MKLKLILVFLLPMFLFFSCEKEDPVIPNEEELITTLIFTLQPVTGGDAIEFKFQDIDGDGGNPPEISTAPLLANTTYSGTLTFLNELNTPALDITEEVKDEAESHQVFYQSAMYPLTITYEDEDSNGNPLGVKTTVVTSTAGTGELTIILRHLPIKPNNGNPSEAGGETDIEVTFPVVVK